MKTCSLRLLFLLITTHLFAAPYDDRHKKTVFIFVHGIFDSSCQAEQYKEIFPNDFVVSFDFNDAFSWPFLHRLFLTSLAQEDEIETLHHTYESVVTFFQDRSYPVPRIVLIGISRGASVILNFLALKKPKYVTAAICESPFDSMKHVAEYAVSALPSYAKSFGKKLLLSCFYKHNPSGICPANCVKEIDPNIPILLIASKQDWRVPLESTAQLYKIMKNTGKNVVFKIFEHGKHAKILNANKVEYERVVEKFLTSKSNHTLY